MAIDLAISKLRCQKHHDSAGVVVLLIRAES